MPGASYLVAFDRYFVGELVGVLVVVVGGGCCFFGKVNVEGLWLGEGRRSFWCKWVFVVFRWMCSFLLDFISLAVIC